MFKKVLLHLVANLVLLLLYFPWYLRPGRPATPCHRAGLCSHGKTHENGTLYTIWHILFMTLDMHKN